MAACYGNFVYTKPSQFLKPNPESDQKSNRKPEKTNGPNRKSNRLKNKKNPHTLCHTGLLLGLIDAVQCLRKLRTLASFKQSVTRKFKEPILIFQTERVSFAQTLYQHKSALPYMGLCTLSCSSTKRPRRLISTIQKNSVGIGKNEVAEVHDDVKLSRSEVRPAN